MVRIFFVLPLLFGLVLFPHLIVGEVEIPNMHPIDAPDSQLNKPNFESQAPISQGMGSSQGQAESPSQGQKTEHQTQGGGQSNPMIEKACEPTKFKQLCIDSLKAEPMSGNADMKSLAFLSLNITKNEAYKVSEWIFDQLDDPELSAGAQQAYTDCGEQYTDAVAQVEDSMLAFFANALNDIEVWMGVAIGNAGTCEEALKTNNCTQAMGNKNEVFKEQATNSLNIVTRMMSKT